MKFKHMALLSPLVITFIACLSTYQNEGKVPFNVHKPEIKIEISAELKEISGLTWFDNNRLAAVQDEAGVVYLLDAGTGKIVEKIKFSLPGDFEGIALAGNRFYALTSSGTLFSFTKDNARDVRRHPTPLSWRNDAEGLAYDKKNHRLLIACKENGGINGQEIKGKAIYGYSLSTFKLTNNPVAIIKKSALTDFRKIDKFKPSAIGIDPLTEDIYLLASAGNLLVTLSADFKIKSVTKLPKEVYPQPEGICFSPEGDMFISNEGNKSKPTIYHLLRTR